MQEYSSVGQRHRTTERVITALNNGLYQVIRQTLSWAIFLVRYDKLKKAPAISQRVCVKSEEPVDIVVCDSFYPPKGLIFRPLSANAKTKVHPSRFTSFRQIAASNVMSSRKRSQISGPNSIFRHQSLGINLWISMSKN